MGKGTRGGRRAGALYSDADNYEEFQNKNINKLIKNGIRSVEQSQAIWRDMRLNKFKKDVKETSIEEAVDTLRNNVSDNLLRGWFVNADSGYKPKIIANVLKNQKTYNASLNVAYDNYKNEVNSNISFNKWLNTPITVYRGTSGQKEIGKDVWSSFTYKKEIAKKFGSNIETIKIKPKDTYGSMQTTGETEILVPKEMLKKIRKK